MSCNRTRRRLLPYFYGTMVGAWWYHGAPRYPQSGKGRSGRLELAHARVHFVNAI